MTTAGLLNGHNIYATNNEETETDALAYLRKIYFDFSTQYNEEVIPVTEKYAATLLNENQDRIKYAFTPEFKVKFRGTSCISRCCRCEKFADSSIFVSNIEEEIYFKTLMEDTFFIHTRPTWKVLYRPVYGNDSIKNVQHILFGAFGGNLSELSSLLKQYYQTNKGKYNDSTANITDETFSDENIRKMLFVEANEIPKQ